MQGRKTYHEKFFTKFRLSQRVPKNNFYRRLKNVLKLDFLYRETRDYYAQCGQKSIDPIVFFKICLVGYLENITMDRQLIEFCSLRLDILYFLGYDVDEKLPFHTTISRTRNKFPKKVYNGLLNRVLDICVASGIFSERIHIDNPGKPDIVYYNEAVSKTPNRNVFR